MKDHRFFCRLAALSLLSVGSVVAEQHVSGEIYFQGRSVLNHETQSGAQANSEDQSNDSLQVTWARADFSGDIVKNWQYALRLQYDESRNDQIGIDPGILYSASPLPFTANSMLFRGINMLIGHAYASYSGIEGAVISAGRLAAPEITSDRLYYQPYIGFNPNNRPVGTVANDTGDHPGASLEIRAEKLNCTLGVWKQTDLRAFDLNAGVDVLSAGSEIRLGFGGRLSYSFEPMKDAHLGVGFGYSSAPLNEPVIIGLSSTYDDGGSVTVPSFVVFTDLNITAADVSFVMKNLQINAGFQNQKAPDGDFFAEDVNDFTQGNLVGTGPSSVFRQSGTATAFWGEVAYLLQGEGYHFDQNYAVISGVKLRKEQHGFEVIARYGVEKRSNVLALLTPTGWRDFRTTAAGNAADDNFAISELLFAVDDVDPSFNPTVGYAYALITNDTEGSAPPRMDSGARRDVFNTQMTGFSLGVNYYLAENAILKLEYENRHNEFKRSGGPETWTDSLLDKNIGTLRLQGQYSF